MKVYSYVIRSLNEYNTNQNNDSFQTRFRFPSESHIYYTLKLEQLVFTETPTVPIEVRVSGLNTHFQTNYNTSDLTIGFYDSNTQFSNYPEILISQNPGINEITFKFYSVETNQLYPFAIGDRGNISMILTLRETKLK